MADNPITWNSIHTANQGWHVFICKFKVFFFSVFIAVAAVHLDIQTAPTDKLCSFHNRHTGTSPGISAQSVQSMLLLQWLYR